MKERAMKAAFVALMTFAVVIFVGLTAQSQFADQPPPPKKASVEPDRAEKTTAGAAPRPAAIQWFATWESGLAEAQRSGRPILLVAAAPHCAGVSGIW
jgi:hypothetical protein